MRKNIEAVHEAMARGTQRGAASILGVHLEGPFLNPARKGALEAGAFLSPTLRNLKMLISGFEDVVRVITIAPELGGALKVMERCGLAGLGLLDDDLYVEVVADGVHLSPETLRLVFRTKPGDRILLVSDSVKGSRRINGVLQGGKTSLPEACDFLGKIGIPRMSALRAAKKNPARYIAGY
jgi:N-acetylglucosamine-6-phosphate deacetylase